MDYIVWSTVKKHVQLIERIRQANEALSLEIEKSVAPDSEVTLKL